MVEDLAINIGFTENDEKVFIGFCKTDTGELVIGRSMPIQSWLKICDDMKKAIDEIGHD